MGRFLLLALLWLSLFLSYMSILSERLLSLILKYKVNDVINMSFICSCILVFKILKGELESKASYLPFW